MKQVRKSRVSEWLDSEPAKLVLEALESERETLFKQAALTFVSGKPNLTHEIRAKLVGREFLLETLIDFMKGDLGMLFHEENGFEVIDDMEIDDEK